jgi:hypothetical protein
MADMQWTATNSERSAFNCKKKWMLEYGLGIRDAKEKEVFKHGTLMHSAIDHLWDKGLAEAVLHVSNSLKYDEAIRDNITNHLIAYYQHYETENEKGFVAPLTNFATEMHLESKMYVPGTLSIGEDGSPVGGVKSPVTSFGGVADKLALDMGDGLWVTDHKFTSISLSSWEENFMFSPQVVGYCALVWLETGVMPKGVCYDLIQNTKGRLNAEPKVKVKKVNGLWELYSKTVESAPYTPKFVDNWIKTNGDGFNLNQLNDWRRRVDADAGNSRLFRRHFIPVAPERILKMCDELYFVATEIRRAKQIMAPYRDEILKADPEGRVQLVLDCIDEVGYMYPTNPNDCNKWGRRCSSYNMCVNPCVSSMGDRRIALKVHEEMEESDGDKKQS